MEIDEILSRVGGLQQIARELGMSEGQAKQGAAALAPAILGGFRKQAQSPSAGTEGIGELLSRLGGAGLLEDVLAPEPTNVDRGNQVLGQIFGSKEVSRAVAQNASDQTGLDPSVLKRMLPMLGMMVAGHLARERAGSSATPVPPSGGSGLGDLLGGLLGGGPGTRRGATDEPAKGLGALLDMDGDGNPLDDVLRAMGKLRG